MPAILLTGVVKEQTQMCFNIDGLLCTLGVRRVSDIALMEDHVLCSETAHVRARHGQQVTIMRYEKLKRIPLDEEFHDYSNIGLRYQVDWLKTYLSFPDQFFANLLNIDEASLGEWRENRRSLAPEQRETLEVFCRLHRHVMAVFDFDLERMQKLYDIRPPALTTSAGQRPPWQGNSLRSYLEANGKTGITTVAEWFYTLRFGDSY